MGRAADQNIKFVLAVDVPDEDGTIDVYYFYSFESEAVNSDLLFTGAAAKAFKFHSINAAWWMQTLWPELGRSYVCGIRVDAKTDTP